MEYMEEDLGEKSASLSKAVVQIEKLKEQSKYGILRCDYEYIPTRGDPGAPETLTARGDPEPVIVKVEGWTFEAAQRGVAADGSYPASEFRLIKADGSTDEYWTKLWEAYDDREGYIQAEQKVEGDKYVEGYFEPEDYEKGLVYRYEPDVVYRKMEEAVETLDEQNVCGMTADVGFSQAFQSSVIQMTSTPVMLSSLQQLSLVSKIFYLGTEENPSGNKIIIMTANGKSFDENLLIPDDVPLASLEIIGMEETLFGKWVGEGRSFSRLMEDAYDNASVEEAMESVLDTIEAMMQEVEDDGGKVVAIVQECAELPAYTNAARVRFGIPVYDTITAINFIREANSFGVYGSYMM